MVFSLEKDQKLLGTASASAELPTSAICAPPQVELERASQHDLGGRQWRQASPAATRKGRGKEAVGGGRRSGYVENTSIVRLFARNIADV